MECRERYWSWRCRPQWQLARASFCILQWWCTAFVWWLWPISWSSPAALLISHTRPCSCTCRYLPISQKVFPGQFPGSRACIACAAAVQLALSYQCEGCVSAHQACCNVDDLVCCSLFHAAAHGGNRRSPAEEVLGTAASTYGCFVSTQNMQVALCRVCRLPCLVLNAENAGQPVALMLKQVDQ